VSGHEVDEAPRPKEASENHESNLSTQVQDMGRGSNLAAQKLESQQRTDQLVKDGALPQLDFIDMSGGAAKAAERSTEYSNGVKTTRTEGETKITDSGNVVTIEPSIMVDVSKVQPQPARQELDKDGNPTGTILDRDGKAVARNNDDGSVSVFERDSKGKVETTTEYPSGVTIRTGEPVTETRDGRTITMQSSMVTVPEGAGWQQKDDGSYVNKAGDTIRTNSDGGVTMTTKDGTTTQHPDGSITSTPKTAQVPSGGERH